jgi:hypothetical protein
MDPMLLLCLFPGWSLASAPQWEMSVAILVFKTIATFARNVVMVSMQFSHARKRRVKMVTLSA